MEMESPLVWCPIQRIYLLRYKTVRSRVRNRDRFIPNRSAMDWDSASYAIIEALRNRTTNAFRNKEPIGNPKSDYSDSLYPKFVKPSRRHIPQTPHRMLDAPDIVDDFYLNLLDWSSGNVVAIALENSVYLWDASDRSTTMLVTVEEDQGRVTSVNWAAADRSSYLTVGLNNSDVQIWDCSAKRLLRTFKGGHSSRVGSMAWNKLILTTGGMDGQIINNDIRIRSGSGVVSSYRGHTQEVCGLKWSESGKYLASGGNDNIVHVWDRSRSVAASTEWLHRFEQHTSAVKDLAWCPFQENLLATGGGVGDGTIKFWNVRTGACLNSVETGSEVCGLLWSKSEKELLSSHGFALTLWKYPSMVQMTELSGHASSVLFMAQSPDGCTVASAAGDEKLMFWNVFGVPDVTKKAAPKALAQPFANVNHLR